MSTYTEVTWHVRLKESHYRFFHELAIEKGDTEQGAEARQCRKFLNEKIADHKRKVGK